jgi:hypothetical protein
VRDDEHVAGDERTVPADRGDDQARESIPLPDLR